MGEHIIGRLDQKNRKNLYEPGGDVCTCGYCSAFTGRRSCEKTNNISDWEIDSRPCCGGICQSQPLCVHPDRDECFIGNDENKASPLLSYQWDGRAPRLKCTYDLNKISTRNQVQNFTDKFGLNNDVMAKFCTQKVTTCPFGLKECSRLKSTTSEGDECRQWFEAQSSHVQDAAIQSYCLKNNTPDCDCVNRFQSSVYNALKGAHIINDGCWYTPCTTRAKNLIPSQLLNPTCPDKMCQQIYDIVNAGNVTIKDVENVINCDFSGYNPPPSPPTATSFFSSPWIMLALGVFLIIVFGFIAL